MSKSLPRSIRLDADLLNNLLRLAKAQNRSVNNLIETILLGYIEEYELLTLPDFRKALKESEEDKGISWREAMQFV